MINDPRKTGDLIDRLRWLGDEFDSLADLVQYDRGSRESEAETRVDIEIAHKAVEEAIAIIKVMKVMKNG